MKTQILSFITLLQLLTVCHSGNSADPIRVENHLELFVDDKMIESKQEIKSVLHRPKPAEVVLVTDQPWEGNTCAYYTLFQDGERYRMYYRGSHYDTDRKTATHEEVVCYAESSDGIHWEKPNLGLFEFQGSKANNIVWKGVGSHNFTPFLDSNPDCHPSSQYKALGRGRSLRVGDTESRHGLFAFQSADGIHWELMHEEPVITEGAFDSQNLAFYDPIAGEYREYHRWFNQGVRDIMFCTSKDFRNWTKPQGLTYIQARREHLYTNAITPYFRSPQLYIGFPTRYLPDQGSRVEPTLMTSRDGMTFQRWSEPLIPEDAPSDRSGNRSNYMARGILQLPGSDSELSVYATEAYYTGPDSRLRRFTFRTDGFVSLRSESDPGSLTTKSVLFSSKQLQINFKTDAGGEIRIAILDEQDQTVDGFGLVDCIPIRGDDISRKVQWKGGNTLESLEGKVIKLRIQLINADLFAVQF